MEAARHIVLGLAMAAASLHVQWHHSAALGTYSGGALADGVRLPPAGRALLTWDPVLRRSPNRQWRRFGTDRLVRTVLTVARDFHAAHPGAPLPCHSEYADTRPSGPIGAARAGGHRGRLAASRQQHVVAGRVPGQHAVVGVHRVAGLALSLIHI